MRRISCLFFFLPSCAPIAEVKPPEKTYRIERDILQIQVPGFVETCVPPKIWVNETSGRREATTWLPPKGGFYLDGQFIERSTGCDVHQCQEAKTQFISLIEYQKTGEQTSPEGYKLAEYKKAPLTGSLTIELQSFTDKECKSEQLFTANVSR